MRTNRILAALLGLVLSGSYAATQGTLGATSTGTFTNTFNGTGVRQVQILGLQDAVVTPDTGQFSPVTQHGSNVYWGVADQFCVVDTYGGAVNLTVSGDEYGGLDGQSLVARAANGSLLGYKLAFEYIADVAVYGVFDQVDDTLTIPAGAGDPSLCAAGNMRKAIFATDIDDVSIADGPLPANGNVYFSTVTVTATPV
ncbi:hypothetical protein [Hydrogenophaga sp.]|uniref:hypothetical protein n=1 Tax=Hydrogenophaga sp. TaxID=1904254 RepID=UPI003F72AC16